MLIPPIHDPRLTQHADKDGEGLPQAAPTVGFTACCS